MGFSEKEDIKYARSETSNTLQSITDFLKGINEEPEDSPTKVQPQMISRLSLKLKKQLKRKQEDLD